MEIKVVNSKNTSIDEIIEKSEKAVLFPVSKLHWNACTHNPGHRDFIPLKTFNSEHLPEKYRSKDILNYIKLLAALTVRIVVTLRSSERPADYVYSSGNGTLWTGTGRVTDIEPKNLKALKHFCINKRTAVISIKTACHVVYDSIEASHCHVDFFFDDEENMKGVKHVRGKSVSNKNEEEDWSIFECHTSDVSLIKTISSKLKLISKLRYVQPISESLAVIVSHPHGMSKHISFGRWTYGSSNPSMDQRHNFFPNLSIHILDDGIEYTLLFLWKPIDVLVNSSRVTDKPIHGFAEPVGIECDVHFPDGTTIKCHVWQVDRTVKYTKMSLINECGIGIDVPSEQLYLELQLSNGDTQIMKDDELLEYYWNDLTVSSTIFLKNIPI